MTKTPSSVPQWAVRALFENIIMKYAQTDMGQIVWAPMCGDGSMSSALQEYFPCVISTDLVERDYGHGVDDFFSNSDLNFPAPKWIFAAPPLRRRRSDEKGSAADIVKRGLEVADGVAIFAPIEFSDGQARYKELFSELRPWVISPFVEMIGDKKSKKYYAWYLWKKGTNTWPRLIHIPPCKKDMSRKFDGKLTETRKIFDLSRFKDVEKT